MWEKVHPALIAPRKTGQPLPVARRQKEIGLDLSAGLRPGQDELQSTQEALRESQDRLDASIESYKHTQRELAAKVDELASKLTEIEQIYKYTPAGLAFMDEEYRVVRINDRLAASCGMPAEEIIGRRITEVVPPDLAARLVEKWELVFERGEAVLDVEMHGTIPGVEGEQYWLESYIPFKAETGEVVGLIASVLDITARKRAEYAIRASEKRYRLLFERNMAGVFRTTLAGRFLECNPAAAQMFGYDSPEEVLALPMADFYETGSDREAFLARLQSERSITNHEMKFRRRDGDFGWIILNVSLVDDDGGAANIVEGTSIDITKRKAAEERAQSLAHHDALTGLPNRLLLQDRLSQAFATARRQNHKIGLLFLDIDRFKAVNDLLGHSGGDVLLQAVAGRLKRFAREQDTVARLGGDEFLIALTNMPDTPAVAVAARRLMDAITAEFVIQGYPLNIGCSLGISVFPDHGEDSEALIEHADAAMYAAKEGGRNNFQFFTAEMNAQAAERLTIENGLRRAIERKELFLMYQPQVDIATGEVTGMEALLRWQHPELGLVSPDRFIRIAENTGLIVPIGQWVLETACAQARKWQDEGLLAMFVAVNVSAVQFRQDGFCDVVRRVLHKTGLAPQCLELELTESLLLANADVTLAVLEELTAMGLTLAIDDFGTGYSSLSYLKRFPVGKLKIDRSFIRDVAIDPNDAAIATAIISMAKSLNLKVIAEGVENEAQMSFLRALHCDEAQGYYFSRPLAVEDVARTFHAYNCLGQNVLDRGNPDDGKLDGKPVESEAADGRSGEYARAKAAAAVPTEQPGDFPRNSAR